MCIWARKSKPLQSNSPVEQRSPDGAERNPGL
jgi:hypothetical protein